MSYDRTQLLERFVATQLATTAKAVKGDKVDTLVSSHQLTDTPVPLSLTIIENLVGDIVIEVQY